jgi:hypothetical protein
MWWHRSNDRASALHCALLIALLLVGLSVRLPRIDQPPLDFHAVRQYHSLIVARGFYFDALPNVPEWQREVTRVSVQRQAAWEPPILELLVSLAYRTAGGEHTWIPRLSSALIWLSGGVFLYVIARGISGSSAALVSTAIFLLLPFGIAASRSFQPDPLMVASVLGSVLLLLRYYEQPSTARLVVAALV